MKITVIGVGHVGLVTAAAFASLGEDVTGFDIDKDRIDLLRTGVTPFFEPRLDDLVSAGIESERLRFTDHPAQALKDSDVVFICVGRPPATGGDRSLAAVEETARMVATHAGAGSVVVVKSTVPPGTTERVARVLQEQRADTDFPVAFSPEFLREGHAVEDTLTPERIVVGSEDPAALAALRTLYAPILQTGSRLIETDPRSAELSKLSSNAFLALKISFANALARLAEATDADVSAVTEIMGSDARIGEAFLGAGIGFGGYCLPKDVAALERAAGTAGYDFPLLREVARLNEEALESVIRLIEDAVWTLDGKRIALMGVAFKAGTDDVRGSPSIALAERLTKLGATIVGYDPLVRELPSGTGGLSLCDDAYEAAQGAACIVIGTSDPRFAELDYSRLKSGMASANLVDACNALQLSALEAAGFVYRRVGLGASRQSRAR